MSKIDLTPISSGYNLAKINENFDKIEAELQDKVLYRDNTSEEANHMEQPLDMNSNKIMNVATDLADSGSLITVGDADTRYLNSDGDILNGALNINGQVVYNVPYPEASNQASNKHYVDDEVAALRAHSDAEDASLRSHTDTNKLDKSGGTMTGTLDMGGKTLTNLPAPVAQTDAARLQDLIAQGVEGVLPQVQPIQTGDGSTTTFDVPDGTTNRASLFVYINGVYQGSDSYTLNDVAFTITFPLAPEVGDIVEATRFEPAISSAHVEDVTQVLVFDTVADYQAFSEELPVGKIIHLKDRGADFEVVAYNAGANGFDEIKNTAGTQSIAIVKNGRLYSRGFGVGEGRSIDYSAALQATIDSTAIDPTIVNRGVIDYESAEEFGISTQIEVHQKNIHFNGNNALSKWGGNITDSIYHIVDSSRCRFSDMVILGDLDNPPNAAFYFEAPIPASTLGTNENHVISGCILGRRYITDTTLGGTADATPTGLLTNGIVIGGAQDGNNDEYVIEKTQINGCAEIGIDFQNGQSIWSSIRDTLLNDMDKGVQLGCNMALDNVQFNRCRVSDLSGIRDIEVSVNNMQAENSRYFIHSVGGASFYLTGGELQRRDATPSNFFRFENGGTLSLRGLFVENIGFSGDTIYFRPGSAKRGVVKIKECTIAGGDIRETYDIDTAIPGVADNEIDIEHNHFVFKTKSPYGDRDAVIPSVSNSSRALVDLGVSGSDSTSFINMAIGIDAQEMLVTSVISSLNNVDLQLTNLTGGTVDLADTKARFILMKDEILSKGSVSDTPPLQGNGTTHKIVVPVPNLKLGDFVAWSADDYVTNATVTSYCSGENEATILLHNATGGSAIFKATTYNAGKVKDFGNHFGGAMYGGLTILNGTTTGLVVNVDKVKMGAHVFISYDKDLQGLLVTGNVSSDGVVDIVIANRTGGDVTLDNGSFRVMTFA